MKRMGKRKLLHSLVVMMMVFAVVQAPVFAEDAANADAAESKPAVITAEQVEQALARGVPGEEKTIRLTVQADEDADQIVVRMNGEHILAISDDNPRNLLVFETPLGEFAKIPNGQVLRRLAEEQELAVGEIWFELSIAKPDANEAEHILQAAKEQGMVPLTDPIAIEMGLWANEELLDEESLVGYYTHWLPAEPVIDWEFSSGMMYYPESGQFEPLGMASSIRDGRRMLTAMIFGSGYYFIIKSEKTFSDVPDDAPYRQAVHRLAAQRVIEGTGNGTFRPDRLLTRAEAAAMYTRFFVMVEEGDADLAAEVFEDVEADDWFASYAGAMYRYEYLKEGRFNPNGHVTADEIYKAFLSGYVEYLFSFIGERIETGGPYVTRAEAALIFDQMARAYDLSAERTQQRSLQG
ncbi:MAG: hypothetical protein BAA01_09865 [Bacillus thermozeamaize]|uniref:SLH domain-containing protein n=1 Tax=Bacillus thermozeamaize TaxID=230954 RepID=A0A1Y3PG76_9BACI|nr:MAG: hypothetical protein BAA01_09865 [Bacillus thermozeamaize]